MDWKKVGFLTFGILIIILLIWWAGVEDVIGVLKKARLDYFILAVLVYIAGVVLWALRWGVLLKSLNINASFRTILGAIFVGVFVNNVTPGARGGGEPMRMYYLSKRSNETYGPVFATIMADRILDLIPVIVMLFLSMVYVYRLGSTTLMITLLVLNAILAALIVITLVILLNERRTKRILYWFFGLVSRLMPKKAKKYEEKFIHNIEVNVPKFQKGFKLLLKDKKAFLLALAYSFAFWFLTLLRSYFIFLSIKYPVGLEEIMVVQMIGVVAGLISIIPGGAGFIEAINSGVYILLGIDKNFAVTATLIDRLISYWIPTVLGGFLTTHFGVKLREDKKKKGLTEEGRIDNHEVWDSG